MVLPSPGGPWNSTWSSASPRRFAASRKMRSCSLSARLPDEVVERERAQALLLLQVLGQRRGVGDAVVVRWRRRGSACGARAGSRPLLAGDRPGPAGRARGAPAPRATAPRRPPAARRTASWACGRSVAERAVSAATASFQRSDARQHAALARGPRRRRSASSLSRSSTTSRSAVFLPMPGTLVSSAHLLLADGAAQRRRPQPRQHRERELRAHAAHADHQVEQLAAPPRSAKPKSWTASSRTIWRVRRNTGSPSAGRSAAVWQRDLDEVADAAGLDARRRRPSSRAGCRAGEAIIARARPSSSASRLSAAAVMARAGSLRRARCRWQMRARRARRRRRAAARPSGRAGAAP